MGDKCFYCSKPGAKAACGGCQSARYCDATCQSSHWKAPGGHKARCKEIKAAKRVQSGLALCVASGRGQLSVVNALLKDGADVAFTTPAGAAPGGIPEGFFPLLAATQRGHIDVMKALLAAKAGVNQQGMNDFTSLYVASQLDNVPAMQLLLEAGADVDKACIDGGGPLSIACKYGSLAAVKLLVAAKADVNKLRHDGASPLSVAAEHGHKEIVRALLAAPGIKVNHRGETSAGGGYVGPPAAQLFASLISNPELAAAVGQFRPATADGALLAAARRGNNADILKLLIDAGGDVNQGTDSTGRGDVTSPLFAAVVAGSPAAVQTLLDAGADTGFTKGGITALQQARGMGNTAIAKLIQEHMDKRAGAGGGGGRAGGRESVK